MLCLVYPISTIAGDPPQLKSYPKGSPVTLVDGTEYDGNAMYIMSDGQVVLLLVGDVEEKIDEDIK